MLLLVLFKEKEFVLLQKKFNKFQSLHKKDKLTK